MDQARPRKLWCELCFPVFVSKDAASCSSPASLLPNQTEGGGVAFLERSPGLGRMRVLTSAGREETATWKGGPDWFFYITILFS